MCSSNGCPTSSQGSSTSSRSSLVEEWHICSWFRWWLWWSLRFLARSWMGPTCTASTLLSMFLCEICSASWVDSSFKAESLLSPQKKTWRLFQTTCLCLCWSARVQPSPSFSSSYSSTCSLPSFSTTCAICGQRWAPCSTCWKKRKTSWSSETFARPSRKLSTRRNEDAS